MRRSSIGWQPMHRSALVSLGKRDETCEQFMEGQMALIKGNQTSDRRLRFVFREAVVSLDLAANATFEDIARRWDELAKRRRGRPIAIDVRWAAPSRPA